MEQSNRDYEPEPPARSPLEVDLTTRDGHWFNLVSAAQARLEGEALQSFNRDIGELLWRSTSATYTDLLQTIKAHMDVVDTSGAFEAYASQPSAAQVDNRDGMPPEVQNTYTQDNEATP